jgi:hypothetical protein
MNVNLPIPPAKITPAFLQLAFDAIKRGFLNVVSTNEAVGRILLRDSNGVVWEVTVDTSGNLQTAVNDGKSRL